MDPNFLNLANAIAEQLKNTHFQGEQQYQMGGQYPPNNPNEGQFPQQSGGMPNYRHPSHANRGSAPRPLIPRQAAPRPLIPRQAAPRHFNPRQDVPRSTSSRPRGPHPHAKGKGGPKQHPKPANTRGSQSMGNLHTKNEDHSKKSRNFVFVKKPTQSQNNSNPQQRPSDAPPPYDEAVGGLSQEKPKNPPLSPKKIVEVLTQFRSFWNKVSVVAMISDSSEAEVMNVIKKHPQVLSSMKDKFSSDTLVELCPKIRVCSHYQNEKGCIKKRCNELHICKHFIMDACSLGDRCQFGHFWKSGHNMSVFTNFFLESLDEEIIHQLVRKSTKIPIFPNICAAYNFEECHNLQDCNDLHICAENIVTMGSCSKASCQLNHNILEPRCRELLESAGVSTNESPRDLMRIVADQSQIPKSSKKSAQAKPKETEDDSSNPTNKSGQEKPSRRKNDSKSTDKKAEDKTKKNTILSINLEGDVDSPFICIPGIDSKCRNYVKGCKFLHSFKPFHWQFKAGKKWYNMTEFQAKALDEKYKEPSISSCSVPPLNSNFVPEKMKGLLTLLGSNKSIYANFDQMSISGEAFEGHRELRRVSTISSALSTDSNSTVFKWFFYDDSKKWQMYDVNQGKSSDELEKAFQQDSNAEIDFTTSKFKYRISFAKMTQFNMNTGKLRGVRRRPRGTLETENVMPVSSILPSHWIQMEEKDTYVLVDLDMESSEFREVLNCIWPTFPLICVLSISRIQNPHLWKQFKNKEESLLVNRSYPLNIMKLFHGLDHNTFQDVCCNNVDFRIHDSHLNKDYGDGTYFFNNAALVSKSCPPDVSGVKRLLVAHVILGRITTGSKGLTRPPVLAGTDHLYDTTVDDYSAPSMFVKYNKQEYYPSYVVSFK